MLQPRGQSFDEWGPDCGLSAKELIVFQHRKEPERSEVCQRFHQAVDWDGAAVTEGSGGGGAELVSTLRALPVPLRAALVAHEDTRLQNSALLHTQLFQALFLTVPLEGHMLIYNFWKK